MMKSQNSAIGRSHVVWLDVVRFVAMFTVVCCHSADPFNFYPGEPPANIDQIKFWGAAYGSFLRPCVPLFVMITGALLLPLKDDTSVFYKKRISRVFWPFLIWSVLYNLFPWITGQLGLSPEVILDFFPYSGEEVARQSLDVSLRYIAEIPLNFSIVDVHMWYIYLLIGLYLYLPVFSDYMGMLATAMNGLALQDALEARGIYSRVQTAIEMREIAEPFIQRKAEKHLGKGRVVIFACGTGHPYFTTDTAAVLRATEIKADIILLGKSIDAVYSADPKLDPTAEKYEEISYMEVLEKDLKVMDSTATAMCRDNHMPLLVFGIEDPENIVRAVKGEKIGTIVK